MKSASNFDAVLSAPWEDAPRLVYADGLIENDDPRGEFIVLQCRIASGKLGLKDTKIAKAREAELLAAHREEWFGPVEKWLRERDAYAPSRIKLRRGFVSSCRLQVEELDDLVTLFRKAPLLEELELRGGPVSPVAQLAQLERLEAEGAAAEALLPALHAASSLVRLSLSMKPDRKVALDLSRCPRLTSLAVDSDHISEVKLPATLQSLRWNGNSAALIQALDRPSLTTFAVARPIVSEELIEVLRRISPTIEVLALDGAKFGKGQLEAMLGLAWPRLRSLDLSNVGLGLEGAKRVAAMKAPQLELLDLTYTRVGDTGAAVVLSSPLLKTLKEVSLRANKLTIAAVQPVLKKKHSLRLLNLKKNALSAVQLRTLAKQLTGTRLSR